MTTTATPEDSLRAAMADWEQALKARDLDRLFTHYAEDAVLYDVKPPFEHRGIPAIRQIWEDCLPCFPEQFDIESENLRFVAGQDVAFLHRLHRFTSPEDVHPITSMLLRVTVCFRREGDRWLVMHEHVSLPFDPSTGLVVAKP